MEEKTYTIPEAREILAARKDTVWRILRSGVMRGVKRQQNHRQVLTEDQMSSLRLFYYLIRSGTSLDELKQYAKFESAGDHLKQKALLETKKRQAWEDLKNLQKAIDLIERKIEVLEATP